MLREENRGGMDAFFGSFIFCWRFLPLSIDENSILFSTRTLVLRIKLLIGWFFLLRWIVDKIIYTNRSSLQLGNLKLPQSPYHLQFKTCRILSREVGVGS